MIFPAQSEHMPDRFRVWSCQGTLRPRGSETTACMKIPRFQTSQCRGRGLRLKAGMTLAVEPMINLGTADVKWIEGWLDCGDKKTGNLPHTMKIPF